MGQILITGNLGYIGIIMTQKLLSEGYKIKGVDTNYYRGRKLIPFEFNSEFSQSYQDIREITSKDLIGVDTVIHLAALSNDPLGKLNPELTNEINFLSSLKLAKIAKKLGISRFLFSSSCSIYGQTNNKQLDENSTLTPLSAYAHSKVNLEKALSKLADNRFSPVYLRNGTAYGVSPNMRFDLVVNNLTGWGFTTNKIKILSDGRAWRPIVHIRDICSAFIAILNADREVVHDQAFNVGTNSENYQVRDIAKEVLNQMKECEIEILGADNPDQRDYNVNFDKVNNNLIEFNPKWTLKKGIKELIQAFEEIDLDYETFQNRNFTRIKQLKYLIENKKIDENLFWN